jgi:hypothetical protein
MGKNPLVPDDKRILVMTGHYGSGKTEVAVSLALRLAAEEHRPYKRLALVDLDIINPYFRSREKRALLEDAGIPVYGSVYDTEITAELPALSATVRAPLEDKDCRVIIDAGGNDSGARVLNQFKQYLVAKDIAVLAVVNFNRYETRTTPQARAHLEAIEAETGLVIEGVINNTHLLRETAVEDICRGYALAQKLCHEMGKRLFFTTYPAPVFSPHELHISGNLLPLGLHMRASWLDR